MRTLLAAAALPLLLIFCVDTQGQTVPPTLTTAPTKPVPQPPVPFVPGKPASPAAESIAVPEMMPNAKGDGVTVARAHESFSELTLKGSDLHAEPALLGSREHRPGFVRELYQVRWRPNDALDLYVILPVGVKNPPVALYLYSFPADTERFKNDAWCQRVVQSGAAAVGFVSALTGQRYNFRPFRENFISELPEALATTTHDVQMILDYLATRHDLDLNRVGMFGQGSGGAIAVLAAAADPRIKSIDLLDPWGDWPVWLAAAPDVPQKERADYLKPEFLKPLEALEPTHYLPDLKSRKLRIQFVEDEGEPKQAMNDLQRAAPSSATVVRFPSSKLMYHMNAGGRLFEWLATQLEAHPAPPQQADESKRSVAGSSPNAKP